MSGFNEEMLEIDFMEKLKGAGWNLVAASELRRESYEEPLLMDNLTKSIRCINQDQELEEEDINQAITELKLSSTGIEGIKKVLNYFKYGITIKSKRGRELKHVKLFDYENLQNNDYIASRQVVFRNQEEIRTDIILFVNGIPLVDIELKNPVSLSESWLDAYHQIKRYEKLIPDLYKYIQIGVAAEQNVRYFPIVPWLDDVKTLEWKEEGKDPINSIVAMLSTERILDLIKNYLFIREESGMETKVITRYMQYHACEKIVNRVMGNVNGDHDKNKGLIWHWQGSGKTLTMIFAANKLYHMRKLENPSILFILDRLDLKDQLYHEFTGLDMVVPELIDTIDQLKRFIKHDEFKGKKGIFITLIQKFRPDKLEDIRKILSEQAKAGKKTIADRKNILLFMDEAHRTQYGSLAGQMEEILKSGFSFGFTGTPISRKEKDTYKHFAYPPEEHYLDRYFITDSIKDGFTLKIVYQPRLEEDIQLDKKMLKIFSEMEFEEIPEKISEKVEKKVKDKLNAINLFLENPERIKLTAEDISSHFSENVNGKFKAMVVAASRKACVHYKRELDKLLPPEYSEVVMTFNRDDDEIIKEYKDELVKKYHGKDIKDIKKEILEKFKEEERTPKILIVTDMLLTGFDAPVLQTMYLDKPLKEHRLLQAVARTNRPYKGVKEAGLIIDYIGVIEEEIKRALDIYSTEEYTGALFDLNEIKEEFKKIMNDTLTIFESIARDKYDRKTLLRSIEILTSSEETTEQFLENYRNLRRMFEFLGRDSIKLDYFRDYKWLTAIYTYYVKMVSRDTSLDDLVEKYYKKTIKFVHKTTEFEKFEDNLPIIEFDEHYLDNLEQKLDDTEEKASNIVFTLNKFVLVNKDRNPAYESVASKVERVLELWRQKTRNYELIYREGINAIKEAEEGKKRQYELSLSDLEYSILLKLEEEFGESPEMMDDAKEISQIVEKNAFQGWHDQMTVRKKIEREVRRSLRKKYFRGQGLTRDELQELHKNIMEKVERYAQ